MCCPRAESRPSVRRWLPECSHDQRADLDEILTQANAAVVHAEPLVRAMLIEKWASADAVVKGRAKSTETLGEKLRRMGGGHHLPRIRDLAGLRVVADINLEHQDLLMSDVCAVLSDSHELVDRRAQPSMGYRALHAELTSLESKMEIQVRTQLQHLWADAYERIADETGREMRDDIDLGGLGEEQRYRVERTRYIADLISNLEQRALRLAAADDQAVIVSANLQAAQDRSKAAVAGLAEVEKMISLTQAAPGDSEVKQLFVQPALERAQAGAQQTRSDLVHVEARSEEARLLLAEFELVRAEAQRTWKAGEAILKGVIATLVPDSDAQKGSE